MGPERRWRVLEEVDILRVQTGTVLAEKAFSSKGAHSIVFSSIIREVDA